MLTSCSPEGGERGTEEDGRGGEVWQVNCECLEIIAAGVDPGFSEGGGGLMVMRGAWLCSGKGAIEAFTMCA